MVEILNTQKPVIVFHFTAWSCATIDPMSHEGQVAVVMRPDKMWNKVPYCPLLIQTYFCKTITFSTIRQTV